MMVLMTSIRRLDNLNTQSTKVNNGLSLAYNSGTSSNGSLNSNILRLVKFAENEAGIIPKFKHKT